MDAWTLQDKHWLWQVLCKSCLISVRPSGLFSSTWESCCSPSENPAHTQGQLTHRDKVKFIFEYTEPHTQQMFKKCRLNECINSAYPFGQIGLWDVLNCVILSLTDFQQYLKTADCPQTLGRSTGNWEKQLACVGTRHCGWIKSYSSSQSVPAPAVSGSERVWVTYRKLYCFQIFAFNYKKTNADIIL